MRKPRKPFLAIMALAFVCILFDIQNGVFRCSGLATEQDTVKVDSCDTDKVDRTPYPDVSPVIPSFVQNLMKYGEWSSEPICTIRGKVYCLAYDCYARTRVIYDSDRILLSDPILRVDSFASGCRSKFFVSLPGKSRLIDFSDSQSLESLDSLSRQLSSFTRFRVDTMAGFGNCIFYSLCVDFPQPSVPHRDEIRRWIVDKIDNSKPLNIFSLPCGTIPSFGKRRRNGKWKFGGDMYSNTQIADFAASLYFENKRVEEKVKFVDCASNYFSTLNLQAKVINNRFVTFQECTHDFSEGGHGYYTERLISYDFVHRKEIDFEYLFDSQYFPQMLEILLDAAENDPQCREWNPDILQYVYVTDDEGVLTGEYCFPQPGLSDEGVVFSFQPYDISCFAAGTFHFTIPYDKIYRFLSPRGKWCLGIYDVPSLL